MKAIILVLLTAVTFTQAQSQINKRGLEIYQVKKTYQDTAKRDGAKCNYCLSLKKEDLFDEPLLTENDLVLFDWSNQQIELKEKAKRKIKTLKIPLSGLPVAMVLNGEIIYGFWFWNIFSSFGCDWVYSYPNGGFEIRFGLPKSNTYGEDPRFDIRLERYIDKKKLGTK